MKSFSVTASSVAVLLLQSILLPPEQINALISPSLPIHHHLARKISSETNKAQYAIIYGEDGNREEIMDNTLSLESDNDNSLKESLSQKINIQRLIRIGCAFAPPPHDTLHPTDVISANLVSVNGMGVQVALTVPSGDDDGSSGRAAQILVPITFQTSCYEDGYTSVTMEACVLKNLRRLDSMAINNIVDKEQMEAQSEQLAEQQRIIQELKEIPAGDELPAWWTFPVLNMLLDQECDVLKDLLNQNSFSDQIAALFQLYYSKQQQQQQQQQNTKLSPIRVIKACVASVGTSGLFLRAFVELLEYDPEKVEGPYTNVELGIQFEEEAKTAELLRSSLLGLVDSAQHVPPTPVEEQKEEAIEELPAKQDEVEKLKTAEIFQRNLLQAQLQYDQAEKLQIKLKKDEELQRKTSREELLQRNLLQARLNYDYSAKLKQTTKEKEIFQRRLLETQFKYKQNGDFALLGVTPAVKSVDGKLLPEDVVIKARQQPKSPEEEDRLAKKYAQIEDVGERAYTILKDLYMV